MSKQKKTEDVVEEATTQKKTTKASAAAELEKKVSELEEELKSLNDKYLRMAAEYENFRRRSKEEREATYGNAMADTIKEILPIIDNLERAESFDDAEKVKAGLVMISSSVKGVLDKLGVEAYGKVGEQFDPNIHNAIMHDEDESLGENEIIDVFQKGYKKGTKIIRFAMVKSVN